MVPDVTNETIFYKYVVYNHTSCGCGSSDQWKLRDDKEERGTVGLQQIMCENWIAVVSSDLQPLNAKCFTAIFVFDHAVANSTKLTELKVHQIRIYNTRIWYNKELESTVIPQNAQYTHTIVYCQN